MDSLLIANSAITILRAALGEVASRVAAGQISVDAQEALLKKVDMLRKGDFTGPEWEIRPDGVPPS